MAHVGFAGPIWERLRGSGLDTAAGCNFVQQRIAFFGKLLTLLSGVSLIVGFSIDVLIFHMPAQHILRLRWTMGHAIGTVIIATVWLITRKGCIAAHLLEVLDAIGLVAACSAWAGMVTPGEASSILNGMLAVSLTILVRAIIVPSKPGRTMRLSALAFIPLILVAWRWARTLPVPPLMPNAFTFAAAQLAHLVLWSIAVIVAGSVTSRVIYGLRRTIRDANQIGPYTLEEKLGTGGMGEVWRARHRMLVRHAAIKLIRPEPLMAGGASSDVLMRRFEREARATAALRSPHTVQLFDFGQAEDGTLYYVMEMLVGMDLESLVARFGPIPAERAISILRQVCQSLGEAHHNGLTHRDIKPANIFVSRLGSEVDFVKVLDFGLVRLRHDRPTAVSVKLTADGTASGTPAYMAPEIVLGDPNYDHRVDIYAVGCVAYWLVTGKLVFEGSNAMHMMMDHARTPPPHPQTRTELPIPPELEQIILDCLEKDRAKRPQTAAELAERLASCETRDKWTAARAARWWTTHMPSQSADRPVAEVLLSREDAADHGLRELQPRSR